MKKRGKRLLKKLLALVLAVALMLPMLPQMEVKAADPETVSNAFYTYTYDSDTSGYKVELTTDFKTQLNKSDGSFEGDDGTGITYKWSASGDNGDGQTTASKKLPNPAPDGNYNNVIVTSMKNMFSQMDVVSSLDLSNFDTSNVANMAGMFYKCIALSIINFSSFDTKNVKDMQEMFANCGVLYGLDLSSFDLLSINKKGLSDMFLNAGNSSICYGYAKDPAAAARFNNTEITGIDEDLLLFQKSTFYICKYYSNYGAYRLCLSDEFKDAINKSTQTTYYQGSTSWSTGDPLPAPPTTYSDGVFAEVDVVDMESLFAGCSNMKSLDLTNFDTSKVTSMCNMFGGCEN